MNTNVYEQHKPVIYDDPIIKVTLEPSEIPWLIVSIQRPVKEISQCTEAEKSMLFDALDIIEKAMLSHYQPDKINIASFGNVLPQVHCHIMARFHHDSFFPEPMWGTQQRKSTIQIDDMDYFCDQVYQLLTQILE